MAKNPPANAPASTTPNAKPTAPRPETPPAPNVLAGLAITNHQIAHWFAYHRPDDEAVDQHRRIREAGAAMAQIIKDNTPGCADQAAAIRKVREAVMTANAAIACKGR